MADEIQDNRTLQQLAQEALDVQNACNLMGVSRSFNLAVLRLRFLLNLDGDGLRNHAITALWVDKIADMTGRGKDIMDAYTTVDKLANPSETL